MKNKTEYSQLQLNITIKKANTRKPKAELPNNLQYVPNKTC